MRDNIMHDVLKNKHKNELLAQREEASGASIIQNLPTRITLNTNTNCNLNCSHCGFSDGGLDKNSQMSKNMLDIIADQVMDTASEVVTTTRGEPFLFDHFNYLVQLISKYYCRLGIYTNGMLLDEERIILILPFLKDLKISYDAVRKLTFKHLRNGASLDLIHYNIRRFNKIRKASKIRLQPKLTVQYTLMRSNIEELPEMISLHDKLLFDRLALSHYYIFDRTQTNESLLFHQQLCDQILEDLVEKCTQKGIEPFFPRLFNGSVQNMANLCNNGTCTYLYTETWIEPNGDVRPCFFPDSPVVGNILRDTFTYIWNNERYQQLRKSVNAEEPKYSRCKECAIRMQFDPSYSKPYTYKAFELYQ